MKNIEIQMNRKKNYIVVISFIIFANSLAAIISGELERQLESLMTVFLVFFGLLIARLIKETATAPILTIDDTGLCLKHPLKKKEVFGLGFLKFEDVKIIAVTNILGDILISDSTAETVLRIEPHEISKKNLCRLHDLLLKKGIDISYEKTALERLKGNIKTPRTIIYLNIALVIIIIHTISQIALKII